MMNRNWLTRLVALSACDSSKSRFQRRRASQMRPMEEQLETRILLSSENALPNLTGLPGANEEEGEDIEADVPVEVTGSYLTSQSRADSKPMFFNDINQGQLDTCVFMSTLSSVALTDFNLANSISVTSQTSTTTIYSVKLWARNAQNQLVLHNRSVQFDFKLTLQDPEPGDSNEYWPAIFQRAYLDLAASVGRNYRSAVFALESLVGATASSRVMQNSLTFAKQIQTDLLAGRATITDTLNSTPPGYIAGPYGLFNNHAYTVMGIEIPDPNSLSNAYVTVRNPWATDTGSRFFDTDKNGTLSDTEWRNAKYGVDGTNDGLIRLPWSVFAANFDATHVSSRAGASINSPLPVYAFTKPSPPAVTIYEGQRLRVDVPTTHSSGRPVYYVMNSSQGNVHLQDGIFDWEPKAASAGKYAVSIRAFLDPLNPLITTDIAFIVTVLPSGPTIGTATASPTTIKNDGSDLLTFTASNVYSPYSERSGVEWWLDQDRNNQFNPSTDRWLGVGAWQGYLGGLNVGTQTFFARGYWDSFRDTHYGPAKSFTVNVVAAPPVEIMAIPRGGQQALTSTQEDNFAIRTLQDASGQYRVLSRRATLPYGHSVRLLDKNGALLQTTALADVSTGNEGKPDMFVRDDGTFAVVWPSYIQGQVTLKVQWYNANGSPQGSPTVIAANIQDYSEGLQIAGDSAGNLLVAYNVGGYFSEDVWSLSVSRARTVTRAPWRVNTFTEGPQKNPTVALNENGIGVIAWGDYGDSRNNAPSVTVARQVWSYGLQNGDEITGPPSGQADGFIASAVNAAGEFVIAFPVSESLFVKKFSAAGVPIGEAFRANSFMGSYCINPLISLNDAGWMAVAWVNWRQDGTETNHGGVYAQLFDPSGKRYGGEFAVPVQRDHEQALASVVLDDAGRLHFTWTNGGYLNPLHDTVETRMFDVKLPPVIAASQSFNIAENLPAGTVVGKVIATDPNPNSVLAFEMVASAGFAIDPVTGVIRTTGPLDFETHETHALYIRVTSGDGFAVNAVMVNVLDRIDGTSRGDVLELRFGANNVTVDRSTNGGPLISLGVFPLTSPLELQALQSNDTVKMFGTGGNDTFRLSAAGMFVNNTRVILGGPAALQFGGDAGNDTYQFGADTPLSSVLIVETGSGVDTIDFSPTLTASVRLNLSSVVTQIVNPNLSLRLHSGTLIENLIGGAGHDTLTGNSVANTLTGGRGNDLLIGGPGDDTYVFGVASVLEADQVTENVNEGIDTLSFAAITTKVALHLGANSIQPVHLNRTLKLNSPITFENAIGGSGADSLIGNSLNNTLIGGAGDDTLNGALGSDLLFGGANNDTYLFGASSILEADQVTENVNEGTDTLNFAYLTTRVALNMAANSVQSVHLNRTLRLNSPVTFENAIGGSGADNLIGNTLNNTLIGGAGDDILNGSSGNDFLFGGANNDIYLFGPASVAEADQVTENVNEGTDLLSFAALTTSIVVNLGANTIQPVHANRTLKLNSPMTFEHFMGGSGADTLIGNSLNNTLFGGPGDDKLNGGAGNDLLLGGANHDTYLFGPAVAAEADQVTENANEGIDLLNFAFLSTDVTLNLGSTSIQAVHLNRTLRLNSDSTFENAIGGTGHDTLLGNVLANRLTGGDGNNILVGLEGADILVAGTGRDILIGGTGLDILNAGGGEDILIAGRTTSDTSLTSLNTLRTAWITAAAYATRITNLRAGVGSPAVSLKTTIDVLNDSGEDDVMAGRGDSDWFFRALDDVISDLVAGELIDVL
jgi:Ca2+-binding RTX toxin-like protein